jgi:hypothetical protein
LAFSTALAMAAELHELAPVDAEPAGHRIGGFRCFFDVGFAHVLIPLN